MSNAQITINGSIDVPGEVDRYAFHLDSDVQVVFDSLTNAAALRWSLSGPRGTIVDRRSFQTSDAANLGGNPRLDLSAGDYTLTVQGDWDATGSYTFRLLDLATATMITPGAAFTGQLGPANETDIYQLAVTAGERYYFDLQSVSASQAYWRLLDPNGVVIFGPTYMWGLTDVEAQTFTVGGAYTLLVEGTIGATGTTDYKLNVQRVVDVVEPMQIGASQGLDPVWLPGKRNGAASLGRGQYIEVENSAHVDLTGSLTLELWVKVDRFDGNWQPLVYKGDGSNDGLYSLWLTDGGTVYWYSITGSKSIQTPSNAVRIGEWNHIAAVTDRSAGQMRLYVNGQLSVSAAVSTAAAAPNSNTMLVGLFVRTASNYKPFDGQIDELRLWNVARSQTDIQANLGLELLGNEPGLELYLKLDEASGNAVTDTTGKNTAARKNTYSAGSGLVAGRIEHVGQQRRYTFTLSGQADLYFDALTYNGYLTWSLKGPRGTVVSGRNFTASDGTSVAGNPALTLVAGDYTITIDGTNDTVGGYAFRLLDMAAAIVLVLGTTMTGQLEPANETDLFRFDATAGERFYFDLKNQSGSPVYWRLVDPNGQVVFGPSSLADIDVRTLTVSGTYMLMVEGYAPYAMGKTTYAFVVQKVTDTDVALTLGTSTNGTIDHAGQQVRHPFTLATATQVVFDAMTNDNRFKWTLTGPRGDVVTARGFTQSDSANFSGNPLLDLVAGDYTLTIDADADTIGAFAFRLLDVASALPLVPGTPITGQLAPGNQSRIYQFSANAGDQFYFDQLTSSGPTPYWRLIGPFGHVVFGPTYFGDVATQTLPYAGAYTLLVEGYISQGAGNTDYQFNVVPQGNVPISPPALGTALTLGSTVGGTLGVFGQKDNYNFTLGNTAQLYFDAMTNSSLLRWSLTGPRGLVIDRRVFTSSDGSNLSGNPLLELVAGSYVLTIESSSTGAYAFRLLDATQATLLVSGTPDTATLTPANTTKLYRLSVVAGERYYFDLQNVTGSTPYAYWRLVDPYGRVVFGPAYMWALTDVDVSTMAVSGTYMLLVEGGLGYPSGTTTYTLNAQKVVDFLGSLTLGATTSGMIDHVGKQERYAFTLAGAAQVYFDALTNSSKFTWSLSGPRGAVVSGRNFTSSDLSVTNPLLELIAGDYVLTIDGVGDGTGNYTFRVLDIATAPTLTPGTAVTGLLNPANGTNVYRFNINAGERFYFDRQTITGDTRGNWRLLDPYGQVVVGPGSLDYDIEVQTIPSSGMHVLLLEGAIYAVGTTNYTVNVQKVVDDVATLALGVTTSGAIAHVGQQDRYTFSLASAAKLHFDALSSSGTFTWSLSGPRGVVVNARSFTGSDSATTAGNWMLELVAGDYVLTVDGVGDATGSYSFRLLDVAAATALLPGTPVTGQLTQGSSTTIYQFTAGSGERFYFDVQNVSGSGNAYWRLIGPTGRVVFGPNYLASYYSYYSDVDGLTLDIAGTYSLLIEGTGATATTVTYTFNVQKVIDDVTSLVLGTITSGAIAHVGQQDRYDFTLAAPARLYFDSLTNSGSLNWSLRGPRGALVSGRALTSSDSSGLATGTMLELVEGSYSLVIDGANDSIGAYAFQLLDVASAATGIVLGTPFLGQLTPANSTNIYRFDAIAGERFYFDIQSYSGGSDTYWRLLDPNGLEVYGPVYMWGQVDLDVRPLPITGNYLLLVEGQTQASGTRAYKINVQKVTDEFALLALGATTTATVDHVGKRVLFSFTIPAPTQLYFDVLTSTSGITFSLAGPRGTLVAGRNLTSSDGPNLSGNPLLPVVPGDYTLTIDGNTDAVGSCVFRVLDIASATEIVPNINVVGQLDVASKTDLYRFNATAGDRFYFDKQTITGNSPYWRLIDPGGHVVFGPSGLSDVDVLTLGIAGTYFLMIEGPVNAAGATNYQFNVQKVLDDDASLALGVATTGTIDHAGQEDRYQFTLANATQLCFDALGGTSSFSWRLVGPRGRVVDWRSFTSSDAGAFTGSPMLDLAAGDYTLTVDGATDATGAYAFRLLDLSTATTIVPGTNAVGQLGPANTTNAHRFDANAGDKFDFLRLSLIGAAPYWRLLDPWGRVVFGPASFSNTATQTLGFTGTYTLLVEGSITSSGTVDYGFKVDPKGNAPVAPLPVGTPMTLGSTVTGTLAAAADKNHYSLSLAAPAQVYMDSLSNTTINWSLTGPRGILVGSRQLYVTDSWWAPANPVIDLVAGDYVVTVTGGTGGYGFRLLDVAAATALVPGTAVTGQLNPATQTNIYRFTATAGQRFYFDSKDWSGQRPIWRLLDPNGELPMAPNWLGDVDVTTVSASGIHTLFIEGLPNSTTTTYYTINLQPVLDDVATLTLGATTSGTIDHAGQQDRYVFTLPNAAQVYFDSLTGSGNFAWSLTGPVGSIINARSFTSSDAYNFSGNPLIDLPAGDYTLIVDGSADTVGAYAFRLLDAAAATPFVRGSVVIGALNPATASKIYVFDATAGDRVFFDVVTLTGGSTYWRLLDPAGQVVFGPIGVADIDVQTLTRSGTHTLFVEGNVYTTGTNDHKFVVQTVSDDLTALTFGTTISGTIAHVGQQDRFTFSLANSTLLYFDSLTNSSSLNWSLTGPRGKVVNNRSFDASDSPYLAGNPLLDVVAGDYTLTIDGVGDTIGNYAFRLLDVGAAPLIVPGTVVNGQLSPSNKTDVFRFNAAAGQRFYFDLQNYSGYQPGWRLVDPYGHVVFGPSSITDVQPPALEFDGLYTLLLEGQVYASPGAVNYAFNVIPTPLTQTVDITGLGAQPGPDLVVSDVVVTGDQGILCSGGNATVTWNVANQGNLPTQASWQERVTIRNADRNELIGSFVVPYDAAVSGAMLPGDVRPRQSSFTLPDGNKGAGNIWVQVTTDLTNVIAEGGQNGSGEANNSASVTVISTLKPYADLQVSSLSVDPPSGWLASSVVTLHWRVNNIGNAAATHSWTDLISVRNVLTNQTLFTQSSTFSVDANGPVDSSTWVDRELALTWPSGPTGIGRFEFTVVTDSSGQIVENNAGNTGETNNSATLLVSSAPDLLVTNLHTAPTSTQAGDDLAIHWDDLNGGVAPTGNAWFDRLVVQNMATGEKLVDTTLYYDPDKPGAGAIMPGQTRSRSYGFRLPDGVRGAGSMQITVTADKTSSVFEDNPAANAETNNAASLSIQSLAKLYADLAVSGLSVPSTVNAGAVVAVSFTVGNIGQADTATGWTDRIVLSQDVIIGNADDVVLANVVRNDPLPIGDSYTQTRNVQIPSRIDGQYRIAVIVDALGKIIEPDTLANNVVISSAITIAPTNADLVPEITLAPTQAGAGQLAHVEWKVVNQGTVATDVDRWVDQLYLSTSQTLGAGALLLGSLTHIGVLDASGDYTAALDVTLPRSVGGQMYFLVKTDAFGTVFERNNTTNNTAVAPHPTAVAPEAKPNLKVSALQAPAIWRAGDTISLSYTVSNTGDAPANCWLAEKVRLVDVANAATQIELNTSSQNRAVDVGASYTQTINVTAPVTAIAQWRLEVEADALKFVNELDETDNITSQPVAIVHPDVKIDAVLVQGTIQGGETIGIQWTTMNIGTAEGANVLDIVYLSRDGVVDGSDVKLGQFSHASIAAGGASGATLSALLPANAKGTYQLLVVTDANALLKETAVGEANNVNTSTLNVAVDSFADLAVTAVQTPSQVIADPATVNVQWTVTNQGAGPGRTLAWTDLVVFSQDEILGNADDLVLAQVRHDGALQAGESYSGNATYTFGPAFSKRGHVFVRSDSKGEVWEDESEANNTVKATGNLDVMPKPYADLQIESMTIQGTAASGKTIKLTWVVANNGIGITDTGTWSDTLWLSNNADGTGIIKNYAAANHIGPLAVGDHYTRTVDILIPDGLAGTYYLNVHTGGPFQFIYADNDQASLAIPIVLSDSPDLLVESVVLPSTALEGGMIDITWSVVNQGPARANGVWTDTLTLVPANGIGSPIKLGSFDYDRGLDPGIRYTRTEQVPVPAKLQGLYRVKVATNVNLGTNSDKQVYEYGAAATNDSLLSTDSTEVSLMPRPDLRVGDVTLPAQVTSGTSIGIQYSIANQGPAPTPAHWKDRVYLSLDGTLSADDTMVAQFENASALAPTESYSNDTAAIDIPIRFRGNAYLLVVADANNNVDEYPNETNNVKAVAFYVNPIPFADLVTSDVVAPDQAVHGSSIDVDYKVTNRGSETTRGDSAQINSWTDSVWLARDKKRPRTSKGDLLLGTITHSGHLAIGQDYLGKLNVAVPDNLLSGQYFITVWSDSYDVILEDGLAAYQNVDDPNELDSNNYKSRPIAILGITPPDLVVAALSAVIVGNETKSCSFTYTVENRGDAFASQWIDSVYIADKPDLASATETWFLGSFAQNRSLIHGETYTVTQSVNLAPSVKGTHLIVATDALPGIVPIIGAVKELDETNNTRFALSEVIAGPADLQVTSVITQSENFSGEDTFVTWTVTNFGASVWPGTQGWMDRVYFSSDAALLPYRATRLVSIEHGNAIGLPSGGSYTTSAKVTLPPGTDGPYYIHVVTDAKRFYDDRDGLAQPAIASEYEHGHPNNSALEFYAQSAFEGAHNDNNIGTGTLSITYREPDLQIDNISVSDPTPHSGQLLTVTWAVTNRGTRATRTNAWLDGVYLSRDASLDAADYPAVDRGSQVELLTRTRSTSLFENGKPRYLAPGDSYTNSATFLLPESISGSFFIIVAVDTRTFKDVSSPRPISTIRDDLDVVFNDTRQPSAVGEFKDEGNNVASLALPILLATPPDLQVTQVLSPAQVVAGQPLQITYHVDNAGGATPSDQQSWFDMVFLSKDRFLDVNKDRYLGYVTHNGGLSAGNGYDATITVTTPRDLAGPYYVFVIADPPRAWGAGEFGRVREFGKEQNNATATIQPILIELPPPADLVVTNVVVPGQAAIGDDVTITFTILNDSNNMAFGRWTDAVYLSSDNIWGLDDKRIGKVEHVGDLAGGASYNATLTAKLPPLKDGNWRVIVRPDVFNEVYEGTITYTNAGLQLPPGEANNRTASASTLDVSVPILEVANPLSTTLTAGQSRLYKVTVAAGETLRVTLDASAEEGANELYIRYGDVPTGFAYDASYSNPVSPDQWAQIPSTQAGDYYVLVRSRQASANTAVTLRADLIPLAITRISPDRGGVGDVAHRWVTLDIHGARFKPGLLVKLSRPGIFEVEPERWRVLDATYIRATFDLRDAPHGLYDIVVTNPDGERVVEAHRFLVERGVEADVTIGVGGPRTLEPGESGIYSVSLQSLTNVDTPYVRFDIGISNMGDSEYVLQGLALPYLVFGTNVAGRPNGKTIDGAGNDQTYGDTPTTGTTRADIPWSSLDGVSNVSGFALAPGYALDLAGDGFAGMTFKVQSYPGLAEWIDYDFEGLRTKLYDLHPAWKEQGLLDAGAASLNNISGGLTDKFLSTDPKLHIEALEWLAMPFRFNVVCVATPLTRSEFVAEQTTYAKQLRAAILADADAPSGLGLLAAEESSWVDGWLGALEQGGLLRPLDEAPPIRKDRQIISLNATLASGILLAKGGEIYQTQANLLGFFAKVQAWYGDTAKWAGDPSAAKAPVEYSEYRHDDEGNEAYIPVPTLLDPATLDRHASIETHFINFNVFVGARSEQEYLRHIGLLDEDFNPIGPNALGLTQYLDQAGVTDEETASIRGPQGFADSAGHAYVPANTPLPYRIGFKNPAPHAISELRIVTELDEHLDARSIRLGDLKLGDIDVHVPPDKANFQTELDFSGGKGFILRISAGIDAETRIATWLLQAINPDSGELLQDPQRGLLAPSSNGQNATESQKRGFVAYTVRSSDLAQSGASITAKARAFFDDSPPVDTQNVVNTLDVAAPETTLTATALGSNAEGAPSFEIAWKATDDLSGIKHVTVYAAADGGEFEIWLRQVAPGQTQAIFTGEPGKTYRFLAAATDQAGNVEAAHVSNAVLPDDGSRRAVLEALGTTEELAQTPELPLASPGRIYAVNALFEQCTQGLPGPVAQAQPADLQYVLSPFTLRGFADGFGESDADIGGLAMIELPDHSMLVSAGALRSEVFLFDKEGGRVTKPLFTLEAPVLDMAIDAVGQLWVMSGNELLMLDAGSGTIMVQTEGPNGAALTHALAIHPGNGDIYVSSGNGVEIFDPQAAAFRHFSNERVADLAFGPDGRLWGVRYLARDITSATPGATSDIVSFPMSGRIAGRAELEYRLNGILDSIAFGAPGTALDGLLLVSSNLPQRPVVDGAAVPVPHGAAVWMLELQSRRVLQLARGGTRGESIVATSDGRVRIAQTTRIDEIAAMKAPKVLAVSVPDGALLPLPLNHISVLFDQSMWTGATAQSGATDPGSVLNPVNFDFIVVGGAPGQTILPSSVSWNAKQKTAVLTMDGLLPGQYQLKVSDALRSATQVRLANEFVTSFTALLDMSSRVLFAFKNTRAKHGTGAISYDIGITNIGTDDLGGPLVLLLDPGRYFKGTIVDSAKGTGDQAELWTMNLSAALLPLGGQLAVGATLENRTITVLPPDSPGDFVKFDLRHGVYAAPTQNELPTLRIVDAAEPASDVLPGATAGQAWTANIEAFDNDGTLFHWQLVQAPAGVTLTPSGILTTNPDGYSTQAALSWTPSAKDRTDSEIIVRVQDSRGGVVTRILRLDVAGGNRAPIITGPSELTLKEGDSLELPLMPSDPDGDPLKVILQNMPEGAVFDAGSGILSWTPSYDQAGLYDGIKVIVTDGKTSIDHEFSITVEQGYAKPRVAPVAPQTAREGDAFTLKIEGGMPGGLVQLDGTTIELAYSAPLLPGGASLNRETGQLSWTPGYSQAGTYHIPVTVTATYTPPTTGERMTTSASTEVVIEVLNANGAPRFEPVETWSVREGQPLRISVFAFDPDNPGFEPKVRLSPVAAPVGPETTAPTVSYVVTGLPAGASFDNETMEVLWTPNYTQAGTYYVKVVATDDGGGTGTPKSSEINIPILVSNSNRAPEIGSVSNAFVDLGATLEIPISASDIDGNPVQITITGLPRFATYTQTSASGASAATGVLRFEPGDGDRGDYTITVIAQDNGDGNSNQALLQSKSFVVTAVAATEAPIIRVPEQVVAVVGQAMSVPITVSDPDQDALTFSAQGLPSGVSLVAEVQYGHAVFTWTPTAADIGTHDISIEVTDSGLGPQDAGIPQDPNAVPVPNTRAKTLRVLVRSSNAAPEFLGVQVNGVAIAAVTNPMSIEAAEGVPLTIEIAARDIDLDHLTWKSITLPSGMMMNAQTGSTGSASLTLSWTPGPYAAQDVIEGGPPGHYHFSIEASDGAAFASQAFDIDVANTNLAPKIPPIPLQIVREGETLSFGVAAFDADGDAINLALVPNQDTPAGLHFDASTGAVEWTPDQDTVDNATGNVKP